MIVQRRHLAIGVSLFFLANSVVAAERPNYERWLGLWCSRGDEIGILVNDNPTLIAAGDTGPIYIYVTEYFNDADAYTVEGTVEPDGDKLELADGDCRVEAELKGSHLIVSNNHQCDRMSADFRERLFTRVQERLAWTVAGQVSPSCRDASQ